MTTIQTKTEAAFTRIAAQHELEAVFAHSWPNAGVVHFQPHDSFTTLLSVRFHFNAGHSSSFESDTPLWPPRAGTRDGSNARMFLVTPDSVSDLDYVLGQIDQQLTAARQDVA